MEIWPVPIYLLERNGNAPRELMVAVGVREGAAMESSRNSAEARIAALRSLSDAEERADLARAVRSLRIRMERVEAAKADFDRAIAQRLDKESRHWSSLAQTAYAGALDDADAALEGRLADIERPLPAAPGFRARAGNGMITLHPGRDGVHRVEYRHAPSLDPAGVLLIGHEPGRPCRLLGDASSTPGADAPAIERAVGALLADPWRTALCVLLDRCAETSLFATCIVGARTVAPPEGPESSRGALPVLRRSF